MNVMELPAQPCRGSWDDAARDQREALVRLAMDRLRMRRRYPTAIDGLTWWLQSGGLSLFFDRGPWVVAS